LSGKAKPNPKTKEYPVKFPPKQTVGTCILAAGAALSMTAWAAVPTPQARITSPIDEKRLVVLAGNTRPEASAANDLGQVEDGLQMEHMQLLLRPSAAQQADLDAYTASLSDKGSQNFHRWLTADEFGARYGAARSDIEQVTTWLSSHGMTVNLVYPNNLVIDFSGTAGMVRETFRAEIHGYLVNGVGHVANASDPKIPAALAGVVQGVVSLHDFTPRPLRKTKPAYTFNSSGSTYEAVTPGDLAKIYNLTPVFKAGYTGKGQTIVVIEDTNVYAASDWTTFRSTFGLEGYEAGSFTQVHPAPKSGQNNCTNPGVVVGNDGEAILDAEYASAAAPGAAIELASCADTETTFGGLIALQNLINASGTPPAIVSISYGECEAVNGAAANAAYNATYQQAASEGVSVFVAAGDEGAASCDANQTVATHGIGVSAFASTPYNVAVGGTDFGDTYAGTNADYWSATNTPTYESALSYIPEIPWNDSCASTLIATVLEYSTTYGSNGFCNSTIGQDYFESTAAGSGGPSGCATGTPSAEGIVGGTCKGYAKPVWQALVGNPGDGVRDIPDVSLFAANGVWGHYYVFCYTDAAGGGTPCTGAPSGWAGAGGTSFASPIMAGMQALVNQKWGKQGNPNPTYYKIAAAEYGKNGNASCNSSNGNAAGSSCVFYDVTLGDIDVNCTGVSRCFDGRGGMMGVLSTTATAYNPAFMTGTGWDFATGIGSVNAYNLVFNPDW
jgi:subtilase family serine protease